MLNYDAQGITPRALFVCTAGMLRSATAAHVTSSPPYNWNTRCAGIADYAIIPVSETLMVWAQRVFCMEDKQEYILKERFDWTAAKIFNLHIPDVYDYRDPDLVERIKHSLYQIGVIDLHEKSALPLSVPLQDGEVSGT